MHLYISLLTLNVFCIIFNNVNEIWGGSLTHEQNLQEAEELRGRCPTVTS